MNVQDLIDELQKVEDKTKEVMISQGSKAFNRTEFSRVEAMCVGETAFTVWVSDVTGSIENYRKQMGTYYERAEG